MKLQNSQVLSLVSIVWIAWSFMAVSAYGITTLKKVQVTDGSQIDLLFDAKLTENQLKTEFFNDIIQLSLNDVSVYPAKISSVSGMELTKVFAYQYSPKLVRCRLTVKGKAEDYQNRVQVKIYGKNVSIRLTGKGNPRSDSITLSAAQANHVGSTAKSAEEGGKNQQNQKMNEEERQLLDRVMKAPPPQAPPLKSAHGNAQSLAQPRPLPGIGRIIGMMLGVLALFGCVVFVMRRVRGSSLQNHKGFAGLVRKFSALGGKQKVIEVVATHHLGPKKSIAVVRIGNRQLVLGVTNESINLISQFSADSAASDFEEDDSASSVNASQTPSASTAQATGPAVFSELLNAERAKTSVRAQIRSKLEGLKPL